MCVRACVIDMRVRVARASSPIATYEPLRRAGRTVRKKLDVRKYRLFYCATRNFSRKVFGIYFWDIIRSLRGVNRKWITRNVRKTCRVFHPAGVGLKRFLIFRCFCVDFSGNDIFRTVETSKYIFFAYFFCFLENFEIWCKKIKQISKNSLYFEKSIYFLKELPGISKLCIFWHFGT